MKRRIGITTPQYFSKKAECAIIDSTGARIASITITLTNQSCFNPPIIKKLKIISFLEKAHPSLN